MTQTLKKQEFEIREIEDYYHKFYKTQRSIRPLVLDYLFRNFCFVTKREKIRVLSYSEYERVNHELNIPIPLIHKFISKFLVDLVHFKMFLKHNSTVLFSRDQARKVIRIFLHKVYHLGPVFNYNRAKQNAEILRIKLDRLCFQPQIMTQIAVVVFITDFLDESKAQKAIQSNVRALCSCSAYAFHRTRNKIGISKSELAKF
ncbi:hypothetical protein LCGC14_1372810 [marine sediment metagenome]|uniref:Uncharacterized protein n=1 Tax=marine sediment metagenome TaxID=412755 RepID=A0A0F9KQZ0_9ZZZZ